ncbi:S8 family serine peptidase [Thalassotalea sp. M1531]|uniref:S8 family serine peptidase n=1 Tax=Thalassotalea algicola TaxID=2716224 RepID=A0A7Y0LD87_9GAMM|nr:S8 family serine peptidase [Thalassotalea algicola]NMP32413.1 S8 family serine peptidase [Thalassotalea algicola]
MKNSKFMLSTLALSIVATTSYVNANTFQDEKALERNALNKVVKLKEAAEKAKANTSDFAQWMNDKKQARRDMTDRLIITYVNDKPDFKIFSSEMSKTTGLNLKSVKTLNNGKHIVSIGQEKNIKDLTTLMAKLKKHRSVSSVEPDYKRYFMAQNEPWGIANTQSDLVNDNDAANMTVCIIDSGYQQNNPDLSANNATGTNNSGTGNWYQAGGSHGTHVAGTIAAVNNSEGVVGVMPNTNVNLHIVKVFNAEGWGYTGDLVDAVDTCVNNGAKVVNMSLGGSGSNNTEKNSLQAAADSGVLLIAAAGNDGDATFSYPASYDSVMAVGAVDQNGQHAEFSQYTSQVEIAAPGEAILSTVAGDGRLGYISIGGTTYGNDEVVPQSRYVQSGSSFSINNINGSANGTLGSCTISGSSYSCNDVAGNICLAERNGNQVGSNYPEINPAKACADAGAAGVIVYSNSDRPGLQNPFLVDGNSDVTVPTVSVNRQLGQQLAGQLGSNVSLTVNANQDYAYYNGTSMATPHVAGVAALVWSKNPNCSPTEVRNALKSTAVDLDAAGRDDKTGYGLVQAKSASDSLTGNCGGGTTNPPTGGELVNGVAQNNLSANTSEVLSFTMNVPAGATDLNFDMSGGSGDGDLYVKFGSEPTTSSYDCRPYKNGNTESCSFATPQAGTYYVEVSAYSAFSGVTLTGSFTEGSTGGGATGGSASVSDISVSRREWKYYTIDIPAGMSTLDFTLSGGTGDADMYIKRGAQPTSSSYDCRPYENGNNETCSFSNPIADTWHIGLYGYRAASGMKLDVVYNP